jgi:hypothetical protein
MFSEDVLFKVIEDTPYWTGDKNKTTQNVDGILKKGDIVKGVVAPDLDSIDDVLIYLSHVTNDDIGANEVSVSTESLIPYESDILFEKSFLNDFQNPNRSYWVALCFLDVLKSKDRDTLWKYHKYILDQRVIDARSLMDSKWWEIIRITDGFLAFHTGLIIADIQSSMFLIRNITAIKNGYKVTLQGDKWWFKFANDYDFSKEYLKFPRPDERESFDLLFINDGDYMDVYLDNIDKHFATFIKVDKIFMEEIKELIKTNTCDLSRLTSWPRRADGRMDYPPPVDMAGYTATHRTTDSLRLRDAASTASLPVTTLAKGSEVQVLETGKEATIDGITAPWVMVLNGTGYTGWCFSGYLEPIAQADEPAAEETLPSAEPAEEASSVSEPIPQTQPPEIKSVAGLPFPYIIAGASALAIGIVIVVVIVLKKRKKS